MNTALWMVQVVLAALFGVVGIFKAAQPREKLLKMGKWIEDFSDAQIKMIGVVEVLAAFGLIVPQLTGIAPVLTPLAAIGLVLTMLGAILVHVRLKEFSAIAANATFLLMAAFVAYGRF
jgi:hypothetical protein